MYDEINLENYIDKRAYNILKKHDIISTYDLAELVPRKYIDYRTVKDINLCIDGENACIHGILKSVEKKKQKTGGREYLLLWAEQTDGTRFMITMFNNLYLYDHYSMMENLPVVVAGKINIHPKFGRNITNPDLIISEELYKPFIKKIYRKFSGISEAKLLDYINIAINHVAEPLEKEVLLKDAVPDYVTSLKKLHSAVTREDIINGRKRLLYNDLLYFAMMLELTKEGDFTSDIKLTHLKKTCEFIKSLPFEFTKDQQEAVKKIIYNTREGKRNNILLQGDVGCGKTVVAACAMIAAAENGYQAVLMAPRSVLASQHYEEIKEYSKAAGFDCVFLHSGLKAKEKKEILRKIKDGTAKLIIGTHSCIASDVEYESLGMMITDEEHLFGVNQKNAIKEKSRNNIHYIAMSATPIPRTVATVLYGDKEIITIKTKPAGRKEIITKISERKEVFEFMEEEIKKGNQCYVVCPAIEENEDFDIRSIEEVEKYYKSYFTRRGIGISIVNGKMKASDIEAEMQKFVSGQNKILISTTVIEVGVNVPSATIMVIEQADRFGLASLHQLRGRVGRSERQSYCYLLSDDLYNERLQALVRTNDGFEIAEADLQLRGTGNLIGTEQAGINRYVNLMLRYPKMFARIKETAKFCIERGYGKELLAIKDN